MAQRHSNTVAVKPLTARSFAQQGILLAVYDGCVAKVALCGGLSCLCILRWHDFDSLSSEDGSSSSLKYPGVRSVIKFG